MNKNSVIDFFFNLLSQFGFRRHNLLQTTRGKASLHNVFSNISVYNYFIDVDNFYFSDHSALCFNILFLYTITDRKDIQSKCIGKKR